MKKNNLMTIQEVFFNYIKRWCQFLIERFNPSSYFFLIGTFVMAHLLIAGISFSGPYLFTFIKKFILGALLSFLFFFKLRLYDEIKDYETDLLINPTRPLPRGLFSLSHFKLIIGIIIFLELLLVGLWAPQAIFILLFTILYSLLMFKEFFIKDIIRPHLTTYALLHTIVSVPFSLTLLCSLAQVSYSEIPFEQKIFSLLSWPLFNIFEFGRKSFLKSEERVNINSYTSIFGKFGAIILVVLQVFFVVFFLYQIPQLIRPFFINYLSLLLLGFTFVMMSFIILNLKWVGYLYRFFSSLFIVLIYSGVILSFLN